MTDTPHDAQTPTVPAGVRAVVAARRWLGTPYVHQASTRGAGCDCLGLIRGVWREVMGEEPETPPPYAPDWTATDGGRETLLLAAARHLRPLWLDRPARAALISAGHDMADLPQETAAPPAAAIAPGTVLLFRYRRHLPARHAGIATGNGTMIHAREGTGVVEEPLTGWWHRHLAAVFAWPVR